MTALSVPVYDEPFYDPHKSSRKSLTPREFVGQLFVKYFNHGWSYIYAVMPKEENKAKWYTKKGYPLELRNLWSLYKNKRKLLGLRFGTDTNYCLFDFDRWGEYHPDENEENFKEVLAILEEIGLCRPIIIRSSQSEGLHVYFFLPRHVHSFTLAATIERVLADRGHFLRKGHLEVFPNPKPYNKSRITNFNGHRLPLQPNSGSYLLNFDYEPVSDDISIFLQQAEFTSQFQDMQGLTEAMAVTDRWYKRQFIYGRKRGEKKMSGAEFRFDLEEVICEGWSGRGQTNDLLLKMAAFGVVFLALSGERLVDYIVKTAINSPGYGKYCGHRHEIDKRAREVAKSAENFAYLPYCNYPRRDISYTEHFYGEVREGKNGSKNAHNTNNKDSNIIRFSKGRELHELTLERVAEIVGILKAEGAFPEGICKRERAIRAKSIEMYKVGGSATTLRKAEYLPLWHPLHEHKASQEGVGQQEETSQEIVVGQEERGAVVIENEDTDCLGEEGEEIADGSEGAENEEISIETSGSETIASESETIVDNGESKEIVGAKIIGVDIDSSEAVEEIREVTVEEKQEIEEKQEAGNSDSSVEKKENLGLEVQEAEAGQGKDYSDLQVHLESERLEVRQEGGCSELQVLNIYEGVFALVPRAVEENENINGNCQSGRADVIEQEENLENPSQGRTFLIFLYLIAMQIFQSFTGAAINSNSLNYLISAREVEFTNPELINLLQSLFDKHFLYSATSQKSPQSDKFGLLMLKILEYLTAKLALQPASTLIKHFPPSGKPYNGSCGDDKGFSINDTEPALNIANNSQPRVSGDKDGGNWQGKEDGGTSQDLASHQQAPLQVPLANPKGQVPPLQHENTDPTSGEILQEQWQAMRFKLQAPREAKRLLRVFCDSEGVSFMPRQREALEQFLKYCLMRQSAFEALQREAREWFTSRREVITQLEIDSLSPFWDFFGDLTF